MREKLSIPDEHLRAYVQEHYALSAVTLDFLPLGNDVSAWVYRILSESGTLYFLKAKHGPLYEASCLVPCYLKDQGVESVVAPLPTKRNELWTQLGELVVILYPFIGGERWRIKGVKMLL